MENEPIPGPKHFGPLPAALAQRRQLIWIFKFFTAFWVLVATALDGSPLGWALGSASVLLLLTLPVAWLLKPLAERELHLLPNAVELKRGAFRRFVVFENLVHVNVVQGPSERLLSLRLDTEDDSVLIQDMEGLPEVFAAVAGGKPERALVELESRRLDLGQPLLWAMLVTALSAYLLYGVAFL